MQRPFSGHHPVVQPNDSVQSQLTGQPVAPSTFAVQRLPFFGARPTMSSSPTISQIPSARQRLVSPAPVFHQHSTPAPIPTSAILPIPNVHSQAPSGSQSAIQAATVAASAESRQRATVSLTTFDIASLSGLAGCNPNHFQHCFGQAMFNQFKVDQLKAIIRYLRDLYYRQRVPFPCGLSVNGRKQNLVDGLVEFVTLTAKHCLLHSDARARKRSFANTIDPELLKGCTCYPSDEAARNAAAIADAAVLTALMKIPDFRCIDGLYSDIEVLASAFLRGSVHMQFKLNQSQLSKIKSGALRVVLRRFCPISTRFEPIDNRILVRVNGQTVIVPPFDSKKIAKSVMPLDVSCWIRDSDQYLFVSSEIIRSVMTVQLAHKLTIAEVIDQIKNKDEIADTPASSLAKDFDDDDIRPSNILVSLRCPLSMIRLKIPAKAITCDHAQCFDLQSVVAYCQQHNRWSCPVCCNPMKCDDIRIDAFFKRLIAGAGPDIDQANIGIDGSVAFIDPESERKRQEAMEVRLSKRRRKSEERGAVQCDGVVTNQVMDGSSYHCPVVLD